MPWEPERTRSGAITSAIVYPILSSVIEQRQGVKVACLEGIAYQMGWISASKLRELAQPMLKNQYGQYLLKLAAEEEKQPL